jgi:hypothetical protein
MDIKLNHYYRTRGGMKAIINIDARKLVPAPKLLDDFNFPYEGLVYEDEEDWKKVYWNIYGVSSFYDATINNFINVEKYNLAFKFVESPEEPTMISDEVAHRFENFRKEMGSIPDDICDIDTVCPVEDGHELELRNELDSLKKEFKDVYLRLNDINMRQTATNI